MLRLRSLSLRVVHKQTAASSSTSPASTGQHWLTTGSPSPMWTNPPRRSTQAPSFNVSMGHVWAVPGGGGHGVPLGGLVTGGTVTGGTVIGGTVTGGRVTGGFTMGGSTTGGRVTGGFTIGGRVTGGFTIGGRVTGGLMGGTVTGGNVIGGLTVGGVMGCLGFFTFGGLVILGGLGFLGVLCFGGLPPPQYPQPRMGVTEEMKSMQMSKRAEILEDSIFMGL